jgi:hypothetical protein
VAENKRVGINKNMRIRRNDLDLLAEAYDGMTGSRGMEDNTSEDAEDTRKLHPLLAEMEDEIFLGVTFQDFMARATKALNQRYLPSRGMGLEYFLDKVGELMKVELEYQPEDGGYVIAVDDLRSDEDLNKDEDAESMLPRKKLRFQSQSLQPDGQKMTVGEVKAPYKRLKFFSQKDK